MWHGMAWFWASGESLSLCRVVAGFFRVPRCLPFLSSRCAACPACVSTQISSWRANYAALLKCKVVRAGQTSEKFFSLFPCQVGDQI